MKIEPGSTRWNTTCSKQRDTFASTRWIVVTLWTSRARCSLVRASALVNT
jgi:hypothetical protein